MIIGGHIRDCLKDYNLNCPHSSLLDISTKRVLELKGYEENVYFSSVGNRGYVHTFQTLLIELNHLFPLFNLPQMKKFQMIHIFSKCTV